MVQIYGCSFESVKSENERSIPHFTAQRYHLLREYSVPQIKGTAVC